MRLIAATILIILILLWYLVDVILPATMEKDGHILVMCLSLQLKRILHPEVEQPSPWHEPR